MWLEPVLVVSERRPRAWGTRGAGDRAAVVSDNRQTRTKRAAVSSSKKRAARRVAAEVGPKSQPEGWHRRLREQSHNLERAIEMLEQAVAMMSEPRPSTLARAECLRGAGLITMLAASELLVVAGWLEADQAVKAGTLEQ